MTSSQTMSELENKVNYLHATLHRALSILVKPAEENSTGELHDILELNIQNAMKELNLEDFSDMQPLHGIKCSVNANSSVRWKFVCVTLHILLSMKVTLKLLSAMPDAKSDKPPPDLLSVSQQKTIRTCLQFVVSMGLLPSLLPGVGVALAARCSSAPNLKDEELLLLEKYERLAAVTRGLLVCSENLTLRSIIIANHLGDLMAALSQLSFVPLKKPVEKVDAATSSEEFVMTPDLWIRLQRDRSHFRIYYLSFIWEMYQPLVIRELLILHGAAGLKRANASSARNNVNLSKKLQNCSRSNPPLWLKKSCIILLIHCIMRPKGVSSLIRAICDTAPDTGADWSKLETVVHLITTVHTSDPDKYHKNICSQLVEILNSADEKSNRLQTMVAVRCIEILYKKDPVLVKQHVTDILMKPLLDLCGSEVRAESEEKVVVTEDELSLCISNMHRLFVECNGTVDPALHPAVLATFTPILISLYKKIYTSPSHIKPKVEELLIKILYSLKVDVLGGVFRSIIFDDEISCKDMLQVNNIYTFTFGPSGGVQVEMKDKTERKAASLKEYFEGGADCTFELLNKGDKTGEITTNLFLILLHVFFDPLKDDVSNAGGEKKSQNAESSMCESDRNMVAAHLLTALSDSHFVREKICSDPNYLVRYIFFILERDAKQLIEKPEGDDTDEPLVEHLFIVLMILSVAVSSSANSPIEGALFESIVEPLRMIRDSMANEELRNLASQIYNKVVTHGVVQESTLNKKKESPSDKKADCSNKKLRKKSYEAPNDACKKSEKSAKGLDSKTKEKSACLKAVMDSCDPMIPVKGHGLVKLTRLIISGDEEIRKHKNKVFLIFQENLNHDDSYIYLAAINGLAALSQINPETIKVLIDEFTDMRTKRLKTVEKSPGMVLKVGEILIRVTKALGDSIPLYKDALLNAFLGGTKDPDPMVRASSLSNLGTVCQALQFRVGPILNELMLCMSSIVKTDSEPEVRRAAALCIRLLVEGLGEEAVIVLKDVILEMHRTLRYICLTETDDVVKLQAEIACELIGHATMELFTRQRKLEKKISVLNPPDM